MMLEAIDHVQLAMPRGAEEGARAFYSGLLGLREGRQCHHQQECVWRSV